MNNEKALEALKTFETLPHRSHYEMFGKPYEEVKADYETVRSALLQGEADAKELAEIKGRARDWRLELECAIENRQEELSKHRMDEDEVYRTKDAIIEFERGVEEIDFIIKGERK